MELKVVRYRNVGVVEDNYVENDYWDEHRYCGVELNNGKIIVVVFTTNHFGEDCKGGDWSYRYLGYNKTLNDSIEKGFLWLGDEVDKEEEKIVLDFCEELELDWEDETDVEEV